MGKEIRFNTIQLMERTYCWVVSGRPPELFCNAQQDTNKYLQSILSDQRRSLITLIQNYDRNAFVTIGGRSLKPATVLWNNPWSQIPPKDRGKKATLMGNIWISIILSSLITNDSWKNNKPILSSISIIARVILGEPWNQFNQMW